jgi:tRNA(Ile)-lysidine synthase
MSFAPDALLRVLQGLPVPPRYVVAYSGGMDSTVLLHALAGLRPRLPAPLAAVHVDHGLAPRSRDWARHCLRFCAGLGVPCRVLPVQAQPRPGESPEAAAREARYRALKGVMGAGELLLTAHHQDDQAETLLLQLLRGAGPQGLAAMPPVISLGPGRLARPLLAFAHASLWAYAQREGLTWVDDTSNRDTRFDRNYLRHTVMPLLTARWPAASRCLARAARHQAQAGELLNEMASADLVAARGPRSDTLRGAALAALSAPRRSNLLRWWLRSLGLPLPSARVLSRVDRELLAARPDALPRIHWQGAELRRYRDLVYALVPLIPPPHDPVVWDPTHPLDFAGGRLVARLGSGEGLRADLCRRLGLTVTTRRGGERCRPVGAGCVRTLKNLLQEAAVPPWERQRLPLIRIGGELAQVGGLWVCEGFQARPGEAGIRVGWRPAAPVSDAAEGPTV